MVADICRSAGNVGVVAFDPLFGNADPFWRIINVVTDSLVAMLNSIFVHIRSSLCNNRSLNVWRLSRDEKIRQTDSVSVVLFMQSTGSVLLAA